MSHFNVELAIKYCWSCITYYFWGSSQAKSEYSIFWGDFVSYRSVDISPTRLHSLAQHFRNRSSSLESQGKLLTSDHDTHPHHALGTLGSPDFFLGPGRSSNGSDPLDDCSSCTSHSSSEHYYPSGGPPSSNPNYSTLGEDSPSKARQRQRQRHR